MSDSSPEETTETIDATAESSPAAETTSEGAPSLAEHLTGVLAKSREDDGESPAPTEDPEPEAKADEAADEAKDGEEPEAKEAEKSEEEKAKEDEKLPFHKHPRWQEIQTKLKETGDRAVELESKLQETQPKIEAYERLTTFCEQSGLENDDVDTLLNVGALLKTDPAKAYEVMRPYFDQAAVAAGKALPEDLDKAVEEGAITEALAADMARLRMQQKALEARTEKTSETAHQTQVQRAATAVSSLEREMLAKDPDYPAIQKDVAVYYKDWLTSTIQESKKFPSEAAAVKAMKDIVTERKAALAKWRPAPAAVGKPTTPTSRSPVAPRQKPPASLAEHLSMKLAELRSE